MAMAWRNMIAALHRSVLAKVFSVGSGIFGNSLASLLGSVAAFQSSMRSAGVCAKIVMLVLSV
jgi:hypothetical protein